MIEDKYYEQALLIRRTEELFLDLFSQGKMNGTVHTCSGQEFSAISFCKFLQPRDFIYSNHRCHGHYLAKTDDVYGLIAELMGKETGACGGIGASQHLCNEEFYSNGIQGGIVPVAAGMALAKKISKNDEIGLVFIGDGTLGQGVVYETFNLCSLYDIPLLIVCEDNGYAQTTAKNNNLAGNIVARAESFDIKTWRSNIWDLQKLFENAEESIEYVRKNNKPAFHLVDTYRLNSHSKSDDYRDISEINEYEKKDPLNLFIDGGKSTYDSISQSVDKKITRALAKIKDDDELLLENYFDCEDKDLSYKFVPLKNVGDRVIKRINMFFHEVMSQDEKVLFIGEDVVSPYGGAFKAAVGLSDKYPDNVISTPISEQAITGLANGLALGGYKPYLEIMFGDFITLSMDQIINHASKFYHMYNKKVVCPVVIRTPMGGGRGYGPTHSQTLDKYLAGIDNVSLIALNSFVDPKTIYEEVYANEEHPVIVVENKVNYGEIVGDKDHRYFALEQTESGYPVVRCRPKIDEPTITIVSYGGIASDIFENLSNIFYETEFIPEFLVLSQISPLDTTVVEESVRKTRNIIVVEEGSSSFGIGAEILSSIIEKVGTNKVNIMHRVGAESVPIPSVRSLEKNILPNKKILDKITEIIGL